MAKTSRSTSQQQATANFDELFGARQGERIVSGGFKMLAHDRITVRPQVRRTFPAEEMKELRASIHELRAQNGGIEGSGVLQALLVATDEEGYRLIAGEKRFRATQAEGIDEVPCVIVPAVSEGMTRLLQLTENAVRSAPPVWEEAQAMQETLAQQKISQRDLARLMGKSLGYITNRLTLLKMGEDVHQMVQRRSDTLKHAPIIDAVQDATQRQALIEAVVEDGLSVKELERRLAPRAASEDEGKGGQNSGDGGEGKCEDEKRRDPLQSLRPAVALLAEAARQLAQVSLSPDYRGELRHEVNALDKNLALIKNLLQ